MVSPQKKKQVAELVKGFIPRLKDKAERPHRVIEEVLSYTAGDRSQTEQLCQLICDNNYIPSGQEEKLVRQLASSHLIIQLDNMSNNKENYKKEFEEIFIEDGSHISPLNRAYLKKLQAELNLTEEESTEVEKPYREYFQLFSEAIKQQYPLSTKNLRALKRNQRILNLTDQFVERIESAAIGKGRRPTKSDRLPQIKLTKKIVVGSTILLLVLAVVPIYIRNEIWKPNSEQPVNMTGHSAAVLSIANTTDGKTLASGSYDRTINIWDLSTGELKYNLTQHSGRINSVAISRDGKLLVSGSGDGTIRIWNLAIGEEIYSPLKSNSGRVLSVAISSDGERIASGSSDGTIKIWNLTTSQEILTLQDGTAQVNSLAFSPPERNILASGSHDGIIRVWDLSQNTNKPIYKLEDNTNRIFSIAISPDGQRLASGSYDEKIRIWDLKSGKLERTLKGHSFVVASVAFSSDGQRLASGSYDNTIRIWNLSTGLPIRTLTGHAGFVYSVSFSPDGQTLFSGGYDGTIKIWKQLQ